MKKPEIGGDLEDCYQMVGDLKILEPGYLPKPHQKVHDQQLKIDIESKGRQARRMNESTFFNKTMVALEKVAGKTKKPWVTLDPNASLIDQYAAPKNKARKEALLDKET